MDAPKMPIVYRRQNLYYNTTYTPRHEKENNIFMKRNKEIIQVNCKIGL